MVHKLNINICNMIFCTWGASFWEQYEYWNKTGRVKRIWVLEYRERMKLVNFDWVCAMTHFLPFQNLVAFHISTALNDIVPILVDGIGNYSGNDQDSQHCRIPIAAMAHHALTMAHIET